MRRIKDDFQSRRKSRFRPLSTSNLNPIAKFKDWYNKEEESTLVRIPSACCLSTIGGDNYPNSRFVSLKEILDDRFVITGPMHSRKGQEMENSPKASHTFWWTKTERQVRIQGDCQFIGDDLADKYFKARSFESQLISKISHQGAEINNIDPLRAQFEKEKIESKNTQLERPAHWSGVYIIPKRMEFMEFKESRFHLRELFVRTKGTWTKRLLQP
ncbi:MAG: pyridoxal 5'-phosphate synthase [Bacteroidota bacterium]